MCLEHTECIYLMMMCQVWQWVEVWEILPHTLQVEERKRKRITKRIMITMITNKNCYYRNIINTNTKILMYFILSFSIFLIRIDEILNIFNITVLLSFFPTNIPSSNTIDLNIAFVSIPIFGFMCRCNIYSSNWTVWFGCFVFFWWRSESGSRAESGSRSRSNWIGYDGMWCNR